MKPLTEIKGRKGKSFVIIDKIRENEFYKIGFKEGRQQQAQEFEKMIKDKFKNRDESVFFRGFDEALKELLKEVQGEGKEEERFYCKYCNKEVKFGVKFCSCGKRQLWALFG